MTDLERAIAATLQAEAQEAAVRTSTPRELDRLDDRLDVVDRSHRRRRLVGGIAAAAAAVATVVVAVALGAGRASAPAPLPPASPTSSDTFTSSAFRVPFTVTPPPWAAEAMDAPTSQSATHVTWNRCEGDVCIGWAFLSLAVLPDAAGRPAPMPGYQAYVAHLDSLRGFTAGGRDQASAPSAWTVAGRPATLITLSPSSDILGGVGCEAGDGTSDDCWDLPGGVPTRLAVVDLGQGRPLVILMRTPASNPAASAWLSQFEAMLATVTLDGTAQGSSGPG